MRAIKYFNYGVFDDKLYNRTDLKKGFDIEFETNFILKS